MKIINRIIAALLFVVFFSFALKNTQEVRLRFLFDYQIEGPLVLILLGFFILGGILGILAMMPTLIRIRRELTYNKKEIERVRQEQAPSIIAADYAD